MPTMTVRAESVPRPGAILQPAARHLHRRAAIPAVAQFRRGADHDGEPARRRQEADGGDRARGAPQRQGHHLRRTDREPDARGEEIFLRSRARPEAPRRVDHLHFARARGGAADLRPHHGAARRQACGDRRHARISTGRASSRRWSGATCRRRSTAGASTASRPPGGACCRCRICAWRRWSRTIRCRSSPARSPASSGSSAPAGPRPSRWSPA